ncbi:myosin-11 [Neltuma alba]|uniref:myosin-11 n=1 Tax=Neltuma alba TaxID=207710 RepID=UPI0010A5022F|nr:myosin-11 [Prosopis alba]
MEDSEKLTALKKAYADIILNTAKEAAARIMSSERRAMRFQRELVSTKEEALRMLLRLKQMLDSKVNEAEMTSSSQQKKIEELEAQLQEAEEIVRDLREELREAQAELEKARINQIHSIVEQNVEDENGAEEKQLQNRLYAYESIYSVPVSQFESAATFDARNSALNGTKESSMCCVSHDRKKCCYIHNPDFASIVIRRKEPELYRNGCTHRIRAFERSLYDGNISHSGNADDVQNEAIVRADEGEVISVTNNSETDNIREVEKPGELTVADADADHVKVSFCRNKETKPERKVAQSRSCSQQVMEINKTHDTTAVTEESVTPNDTVKEEALVEVSFCRNKETKQKSELVQSTSCLQQIVETKKSHDLTAVTEKPVSKNDTVNEETLVEVPICKKKRRINDSENKASYISCAKNSPHDDNDPSMENCSMLCESEALKNMFTSSKEPTDTVAKTEQSESQKDAEMEDVFLKASSAWKKIKDDKELLDESDLTRQEGLSAESLEIPTCRADVEEANEPSDTLSLKVSDSDEKASSQSVNDRFIYTFQRKRKRESLSSSDGDCLRTLKEQCQEKQNGHVEPHKSCTISKSSKDDHMEPHKSCTITESSRGGHMEPHNSCTVTESSRDSRRLAQVARQLISLSEKKWWQ